MVVTEAHLRPCGVQAMFDRQAIRRSCFYAASIPEILEPSARGAKSIIGTARVLLISLLPLLPSRPDGALRDPRYLDPES